MKIKYIIDMLIENLLDAEFIKFLFVENPGIGIATVIALALTIWGLVYILRDDK